MLEQLQNIVKREEPYYLIGAATINAKIDYHLMLVKSVKGELIIEERSDISTLNQLNKNIPVVLHVDGVGVISKSTTRDANYRNSLVFGAKIDDFYFYEYHQDGEVYASIARKSYVDNLLKAFTKENLVVVDVTIGPFVLSNFLSMIAGDRSVYLCDYIVDIEDAKIVSFSNDGVALEVQEINGEQLSFKEIPLMASLLGYLYPKESVSFNSDLLDTNREDFKYKRLFKLSGIFAIIFIMTTLILGHVLLGHYSNNLAERSVEYSMYQQSMEKINTLQQEKELKEKILFNSGINNENFLVKYVSEIGNTVPKDVTLISIHVMAPEKKIRPEKKIALALNTIAIVGTTYNDDAFNDWMEKLREVAWVKDINIAYREDRKVNNTFTLKVKI